MTYYEWICKDCAIFWDEEYDMGTAPSKRACPKCEGMCNRYYENNIPAVHFNCKGFPDRDRKLAKTGGHVAGDSDEVAKELIKDCDRAMQHGNAMYQRVNIDPQGWNKEAAKLTGEARDNAGHFNAISDKRKQEKQETVKKMTAEAYDKHLPEKTIGPRDPRIKQQ